MLISLNAAENPAERSAGFLFGQISSFVKSLILAKNNSIMVLVLKKKDPMTPRDQLDELLRKRAQQKPKHTWSKFFGKVQWSQAPVAYQRSLRDE